MLPGATAFADLMGRAGVANGDHLVAYDDTHGVFAARLLVTAELYGHPRDRLHLLAGDFSAWQREGSVESGSVAPEPTEYRAVYDENGPLVGMDVVEAALADADTVVVDTREADEYAEGHIPGAIRLDWRELVDDDTRGPLDPATARSVLADRKITPDRRVLLYCNTARRISHTYVLLRWLGYDDIAFYEGSLTEWEAAGGRLETTECG
jgi:thiosulfate/3-mercaptopyruvate sulfurtransferase